MARPRGRPKTSTRDDKTVKIERTLADMAARIADATGTTTAEVISDAARTSIRKQFAELMRELEKG
jgi:hypothetical protein